VGVVLTGAVMLSCAPAPGRRAVTAVLGPGGLFGASPFGEPPSAFAADAMCRHHDIEALVDSSVLLSEASRLARAAEMDAATAIWLAECLYRRLAAAERRLAVTLGLPVAHRVMAVLLDLAATHGRPVRAGTLIDLPLTQDLLAAMVGATRESVNRALRSPWLAGRVKRLGGRYVVTPGSVWSAGGGS
jgi:CRP/FNR family transcriptional regulator, cyclic AMP receptor protein